jgi:hypothetical protein
MRNYATITITNAESASDLSTNRREFLKFLPTYNFTPEQLPAYLNEIAALPLNDGNIYQTPVSGFYFYLVTNLITQFGEQHGFLNGK